MPFIIICGRPWYQRPSEEKGIKAQEEEKMDSEERMKSRMEGWEKE